ncbi:MAG: AraC family transcriptional regulator [Clostridia bacterium]
MKQMIFPVITGMEERLPYYVTGVGIHYEQEDVSRPAGHPEYQWIQCRGGKGELFIDGCRYVVGEGQGMLFFPDEPHSYHAVGGRWEVDWIIFHGRGIGDFLRETMKAEGSGVYFVSAPSVIAGKIEELFSAAGRGPSGAHRCSALTYEILTDIMTFASKSESASIDDKFQKLAPVLNYINENCRKTITLGELADLAGVTPQYLCSAFKKFTALTLFEYINMTRIRKSKELLLGDGNMLVKEAAALSGFSDVSYFCAMFRRFEKMSPLEFRNMHRGR